MSLCQVFIGVLLSITAAGMGFAGPIVIKSILIFLSDKKATKADQDYAYTLVAIWITLYFLRIFVKQNADKIFIHLSYRAEQVLSGLIFEKLMRMSCSYRKFLEKGDMFNHLTNDVRYIRNFIQSMGQLFSTPATMLAVQVLLFYYVGIYGFTLTFVYLIGGVILYVLVIKMSKVRVQKLNLIEERLGTNLELITSIKHLKLLGWEDLLPQKNLEYLTNENRLNTKYFTYDAIFDLVNSIFPAMAILLIFVLQTTFDSKGDFDPIQIYTMISVIGMANSPIRQIFNQVIRTLDGRNAVPPY
jgi:ATP-binding cassette subfamily C (CFTR/MRP) protein 1